MVRNSVLVLDPHNDMLELQLAQLEVAVIKTSDQK